MRVVSLLEKTVTGSTQNQQTRWSCLLFRSRWPGQCSTEGLIRSKKIIARFFREKIFFYCVYFFIGIPNPTRLGLQG